MIKLAVPDIGEEELKEVENVLKSKYLVQGDKVEELEKLVKDFLGVKHVVAVSSGTAALHLALYAMDIKAGDEVIVPDFTFPATSNVVELLGASTKFVDIELDSLCMDVSKIESEITESTKAIIPVHEFGQCTDMDSLISIARKYNLKVIEDAACALGAEYKNRKAGTIGDIGCFSLHPRKAITTGEGGIIVTNDTKIAERLKILRNHGLSYENEKPQFVAAGFNYRMTNIQGAIGVAQIKKLLKINEMKAKLAKKYIELFSNVNGLICPVEKDYNKHVWQTFHILIKKNIDRNYIIEYLKSRGIETNFGAYAVHEQPYYKIKYGYDNSNYLNSLYAHERGLALPLHGELTIEDMKYIAFELEKVINE